MQRSRQRGGAGREHENPGPVQVDELAGRFVQLNVATGKIDAARELQPFHVRTLLGKTIMLFENRPAASFAGLGEVRTPGIADLFEAKIQAATP